MGFDWDTLSGKRSHWKIPMFNGKTHYWAIVNSRMWQMTRSDIRHFQMLDDCHCGRYENMGIEVKWWMMLGYWLVGKKNTWGSEGRISAAALSSGFGSSSSPKGTPWVVGWSKPRSVSFWGQEPGTSKRPGNFGVWGYPPVLQHRLESTLPIVRWFSY